jgi:CheY-like chemotaxis protein
VKRELSLVQSTAQKAARLTHQLLAFSRRQVLQPGEVDLNKLIHGLAEMLERLIGENIELQLDLGSGLGMVRADAGAVEQALMNLAVNARDAMPEGGKMRFETAFAHIDGAFCATHHEAKPGDYVRVSVVDTGSGMDGATQQHIFEPFFTTKEVGKGTGLGLAMVYGVVTQHGGWIDVQSRVGEGTRFDVYFPVQEAAVQIREVKSSLAGVPSGDETVLLAEDEPDVRDFAKRVLEELGYTVLIAGDGEDAVKVFAANQERVGLVILDVVMPKASGPKAYEEIARMRAGMPLLYVSGYNEIVGDPTVSAGIASQVLQKPFTVEELAFRVRRVLDEANGTSRAH